MILFRVKECLWGVFFFEVRFVNWSVRLVYFKFENCVEECFYVFIVFKIILYFLVIFIIKYGCDCF